MSELYIGLMSGTSVDGIDAVVVDFCKPQPKLIASHYIAFTSDLRQAILALCQSGHDEINRLGKLDIILGKQFAQAVLTLLQDNKLTPATIRAIGSHGQTVRHHPQREYPFTMQIGDPNIIAADTGITTVADFRRRDIAHGGQGAPLVPAFHQQIFTAEGMNRIILNIGGIANITLLPKNSMPPILGFDTGPGNTLLDGWTEIHLQQQYDIHGQWASQGHVHPELLNLLLDDPFFKLPSPKSTGREYFNLSWLQNAIDKLAIRIEPIDIETTLVELTARSIIEAIIQHLPEGEILVCGGGIHNAFLMERLRILATDYTLQTTQALGIDPDWVEATAFAWLAKQTLQGKHGNIPAVTGAQVSTILGGVYFS